MEYPNGQRNVRILFGRLFRKQLKGYHYLLWFFDQIILGRETFDSATKSAYPAIARQFETTPGAVERGIRYAVNHMESNKLSHQIFGDIHSTTNSQFIAGVLWFLQCSDYGNAMTNFLDLGEPA